MLSMVSFVKEAKAELLKVSWPTKQEAIRLTTVVIAVSIIVGIYIGVLDFFFTKIIQVVLKR